jgi:hypothetical protein
MIWEYNFGLFVGLLEFFIKKSLYFFVYRKRKRPFAGRFKYTKMKSFLIISSATNCRRFIQIEKNAEAQGV